MDVKSNRFKGNPDYDHSCSLLLTLVTLAVVLMNSIICVTSQNEDVRHSRVAIPAGDYWFNTTLCLDASVEGERCGWKATVNTTMPIVDLVVFPSSLRLTSLNGIEDDSTLDNENDQGSGIDSDNGSGQGSGYGQDAGGTGQGGTSHTIAFAQNRFTGISASYKLESEEEDMCIDFIALKDEPRGFDLHVVLDCVCLKVRL